MKLHSIHLMLFLSVTLFGHQVFAERVQKPELSFDLPAQWVEIPSNVLAEVQKNVMGEIANTSSKINLLEWKYAFQSPTSQHWMDYPYILVEVSSSGRVPESSLEKLPKVDTSDTKREVADALKNLADNISIGEVKYDAERRIVWSTLAMNVKDVGAVKALTASLPSATGYILNAV